MIERKTIVLFSSLVFLLVYHYFDYNQNQETNIDKSDTEQIKINSTTSANSTENKITFKESDVNNNSSEKKEITTNIMPENIRKLIEIYGEPTHVNNNTYSWDYMSQTPWNKIEYKIDDQYPYKYYITARINDLKEFENWKNILPNLNFDPQRKSLIFETKDESTALAVANIVISNLQGKLSLEDILNKKLIPISINRTIRHNMIKHKIREQLTEIVNESWNAKKPNENLDYQEDIASTQSEISMLDMAQGQDQDIIEKQIYSQKTNSPMAQNDDIQDLEKKSGLGVYSSGSGFSFI